MIENLIWTDLNLKIDKNEFFFQNELELSLNSSQPNFI